MKKLLALVPVVLLIGCGLTDRKGGDGSDAVMEGLSTSEWIQLLKSTDEQKRTKAIGVLAENSKTDNSVWNEVMKALKGDDSELRVGACEVFGTMGWHAEEAFDVLKSMLNDKDRRVNMAAGVAMAQINPRKAAAVGIPESVLTKKRR